MEQRPAGGLPLKRGPLADGAAAGGASPKREKLQHDPRPSHAGARDGAAGSTGMARSTSVGSAAAAGVTPERLVSRTPSTTVGPGGAAAVSDKVALKQHATLRKHVLIADPSLAGEDKLLEKVMAVMKDTWSWDELKKFILRKADMKENVEATVDLIRDDMDDEDEDEPADGAAARQSSEECEIAEPAAVVQPAKAPIEVKLEPCPASDVAMTDATDGAAAPPAPATAIPARAPSPSPAAPDPSSAAPSAFVPPVVVQQQQQQQQHAAAPAPPPSAAASGPASKKKPSKNLPAEERERLARERVLAQGKVWIEPAKKKAMTALRQESGAQIQRGEFKEFEAQDENGRRYLSIRQISNLRVKERCAVVAVVLACDMRPPSRSDPLAILKLQDPTGSIVLNVFAKQCSQLPNPAPGSILFIRNVYLDPWQGNPTIVGSAMDGYDWFYTNLKVTATTCPPRLSAQFGSLDLLSASQHAYAQKLSSWASSSLGLQQDDRAAPGSEVAVVEVPAGLVKKGRRRMAVEELTTATEFFDLVAQVVKVGPLTNDSRDIFVTDFSQNSLLFKHDARMPPVADAQKPKEPFGRFCLKVSLFNELASAENSSLAVGKIVKLRNAKVRQREYLEASLWGSRDSGCRVERVGLADDGAPELVERRAAFAQELYAEAGEAVPRPIGLDEVSARPQFTVSAPWEKPEHPTYAIKELRQSLTMSCFGQVISVSRPFPAGVGKDKQMYRSVRITDFTAHPAIQDEPDKDPGLPANPPKEPFGRYALRILLTGDLAENPRGDALKTGDYVFVSCLRVNDKGGRGLEAYLLQEPAADYPIVHVNPPCGALGPLLKQKTEFYLRIGSPAPEVPTPITCASPIVHAAEGDDDLQQLSEDHIHLDSLLAPPKEDSPSLAPPDRSSLLKDAPVNTVIDGVFQLVKVHTYMPGKTFLTVTDWTAHALITERHPPLPDPDVVNVEEPFGRFVVEVQVINPTLQADRAFLDALAPGAILRLRGLRLVRAPTVGLRGHLLQTDGSSWERMREDSQDGQVLELQGRRAAIYRLSATQEEAPVDDVVHLESSSPRAVEEPPAADSVVLDDQSDQEMETQAAVTVSDGPSPTRSFYFEGDAGPEPTAIENVVLFPARCTVRARVVDFLPKTLEDVVVCICRSCNVILPTEDRVCRACMSQHDASLGRDLDWTYRVMLKLDDGSDSLWAALYQDDFTALFPSLPPASDYCDSATQIVDRLGAQLALLHPSLGEDAAAEGALPAGPVLELGIESFEVRSLKGVGAEGVTAYKVFRTVLRGQDESL